MPLALTNTLTNQKEHFVPLHPERVTMYVCGPTVYNYAHIGNARPAVVFDVLFRLLRRSYPRVDYARNITDVDDKINQAALEGGVAIDVISNRFLAAYHADMTALGNLEPVVEPRATEHIAPMLAMCERLISSGHAYVADGHVLFAVERFAEYGQLSNRDWDEMIAGARVEVAPYKRHPADFVLWKPSEAHLPGWDSVFGRGRPGWHMECSAMAAVHLGQTIDIHGGGVDLVFPHHENEIAQSRCAHGGAPFARYWLHNGFVTVEKKKMSKSLGNVVLIRDLRQRVHPEVMRYWLLSAHYRQPLDYSDSAIAQLSRALDRLYAAIGHEPLTELAPSEPLIEALEDDLNTPRALAELHRLAGLCEQPDGVAAAQARAMLYSGAQLLGLLGHDRKRWFEVALADADRLEIEAQISERARAKSERDYKRADEIRDALRTRGVLLEDGPGGTSFRVERQ